MRCRCYNPMLEVKNISFSVTNQIWATKRNMKIDILKNISFSVSQNEIFGIAGESGSGKTTLAQIIVGLLVPTSGQILFDGNSIEKIKSKKIQLLFQNNGELLNPFRLVGSMLSDAFNKGKTNQTKFKEEIKNILQTLLLPNELLQRRGFALSGGEQQRFALARILALKPKIIILDEPFSAQDILSKVNLIDLIKKINREMNITFIIISHDLKILRQLTGKLLVLQKGSIAEIGDTNELLTNPKHKYTKFLLSTENYELSESEIRSQYLAIH